MTYVNTVGCIVTSVLFIILGLAAVSARFSLRKKNNAISYDDWLALIALVFTLGVCSIIIASAATDGVGSHLHEHITSPAQILFDTPPAQYVLLATFEYAFWIVQILALGFIKLSILALYGRIFRGKVFLILNWTLIVLTTIWTISFALVMAFGCGTHFSKFWGPLDGLQKCFNSFDALAANAISDVIVDLCILLLPLPFVWKLNQTVRQRIALCGVFLIGAFAVSAGIVRMAFMIEIQFANPMSPGTVAGQAKTDIIGIVSVQLFWQLIQTGVAMVTCCLMTLRPIWYKITADDSLLRIRSLFSSSSGSSSKMSDTRSGDRSRSEASFYGKSSFATVRAGSEHSGERDGDHIEKMVTYKVEREAEVV